MKKLLKKEVIIAFIVGIILASGIVYAATSANQVTYITSKNENVQNVEQALNDLYKLNSNKNLSVEIINNSYTNGYITTTLTKDYDYIIISGCKWYYSGSHIRSNFTVTGDYENYINKFGKSGNDLTDNDASDIAIIKNVKKDATIRLGENNSSVYKNLNIVGICLQ